MGVLEEYGRERQREKLKSAAVRAKKQKTKNKKQKTKNKTRQIIN